MVMDSRRIWAITLFLILALCYGYFMPRWADWGANSRADLVYAIGDQGVLHIDDYHENTGDKACFAGQNYVGDNACVDGHYYTDKSIGPSLVALPFYMVFKGLAAIPPIENFIQNGAGLGNLSGTLNPEGEGIRPEAVYQGMALTFITFFAMSLPSALLATTVFLFAARFTRKDGHAFLLALSYGLGTMAFPYSMALYQHQLAAFGAFVGFFLLWRIIHENASLHGLWLVGLLFSLVVITEYPAVLILLVLVVWAFIRMPNRLALWRMILAGIPLGLLFAAYNFAIFETPMPVGYNYSINWQTEHQSGFLSLTIPTVERLYGLTLSPIRGIFLLSPILILTFPGLYMLWRRKQRGLATLISLIVLSFLTFNASSVMWWGGFTVGPRYLIPILPFMMASIAMPLSWLLDRVWGKALSGVLIGWSIFAVGALSIAGQQWPPVDGFPFTIAEMNATFPLTDYALPLLAQGDVARNYGGLLLNLPGLASLLPLLIVVLVIALAIPLLHSRTRRPQNIATFGQATESLN